MLNVQSRITLRPGVFFSLGSGYGLVRKETQPATFTIGPSLTKGQSALSVYRLLLRGEDVGYFFYCGFKMTNGGSHLLLSHPKKVAEKANVLISTDELVVVDYGLCGALAISPVLSDKLSTMLREQ